MTARARQSRPFAGVAPVLTLVLALALGLLLCLPALAQEAEAPLDYTAWQDTASVVEDVIETGRASSETLNELRAEVAVWRERFLAAGSANSARIATIRTQIEALGTLPEGAAESDEIAARRAELTEQLSRLQVPGLAAVEAHSHADGLIRQIDAQIRRGQADVLLRLSPSPLNPVNWPAGIAVLTQGLSTIWAEGGSAYNDPANRQQLRDNLPAILFLLVMAGLLMFRGPGVIERFAMRLDRGASRRGRRVVAKLVSLGQVVAPVLGTVLLVSALDASGMIGERTLALLSALPVAAAAFFGASWLGLWLFQKPGRKSAPGSTEAEEDLRGDGGLTLSPAQRLEARFLITMLGLVTGLEAFRNAFILEVRPPLSMAAQSVWSFPLMALTAILLFRLGLLLRRTAWASREEAEEKQFKMRMLGLAGTATVAVSLLAPPLGAVGYVAAANGLVWPMLMSLAMVGALILLQDFLTDIYVLISGNKDGARNALIPVLISFALILIALPAFALIWGARVADLQEIWTQFRDGVSLGGARLSPTVFLTFAIVFAIGYVITRVTQSALRTSVLPRTRLDKGGQNAITAGVGYVGIFAAALVAITSAGIDLSSLALVAGALSVGIGFGLQNIVSNFVSGIILLIERPISEGDWIEVGGQHGYVRDISVRSTRVETFDRTDLIVPNADLISGTVTNFTRGNTVGRAIVKLRVALDSDTRHVERILREIAEAHPMVLAQPAPGVIFQGFGADSLEFEIRAILRDVNWIMAVKSDMNHEIVRRFREEGIEIPGSKSEISIRNAEALRGFGAPAGVPDTEAQTALDTVQDTAQDIGPVAPPSDAIRDSGAEDGGDAPGGEGPSR